MPSPLSWRVEHKIVLATTHCLRWCLCARYKLHRDTQQPCTSESRVTTLGPGFWRKKEKKKKEVMSFVAEESGITEREEHLLQMGKQKLYALINIYSALKPQHQVGLWSGC